MPRKPPVPLPERINFFLAQPHTGHIMFCKKYKVEGLWNITPGAILDLYNAFPGLVYACQNLYLENNSWFVGDVDALLSYTL